MRYATAIWNYAEPDVPLTDLIRDFAGFGYDTVSFLPGQYADCSGDEAARIAATIAELDLAVTVHGDFRRDPADARRAVELFGERFLRMTFDAQMAADPRGLLYNLAHMVPWLMEALRLTEGVGTLVGIEDFPLDQSALGFYCEELQPLLGSERYGMLVDVGHLNLRVRGAGYFNGMPVRKYFARLPLPVVEVHLHDNHGERDEHGHFGFGNVDFAEVAAALKSIGFDGVSTIEIAPSFHHRTPAESRPDSAASLATWRGLWEG